MVKRNSTINARFGTICLYALLIISPILVGSTPIPSYSVIEIIAAIMIFSLFRSMIHSGEFTWKRVPYHIPILCIFIIILVQIYFGNFLGLVGLYHKAAFGVLWKFIAYIFVFWGALYYCSSKKTILRVLVVIFCTAFFVSLVGILGRLSGSQDILWFRDTSYTRFFGTFVYENHFAAYIGMVIPLLLGVTLYHYHKLLAKREARGLPYSPWVIAFDGGLAVLFLMGFIFVAALFVSLSRAGMSLGVLAFFPYLIFVYVRSKTRKKFWVLIFFLALVILFLAWVDVRRSIEEWLTIFPLSEGGSFQSRVFAQKGVLAIIKQFPLFGTGFGSFQYVFPLFQPAEIGGGFFQYGHCDHFQLMQEGGIIGYLLMITLFVLFLWKNRSILREKHSPFVKYVGLGSFMSVLFIFIYCFVDFSLRSPANAVLLSVILAINFTIASYHHGESSESSFNVKTRTFSIPKFLRPFTGFTFFIIFLVLIFYPARALLAYRLVGDSDPYGRYLFSKRTTPITEDELQKAIFLDPQDADYHYLLAIQLARNAIEKKRRAHSGVSPKDMEPAFAELERAIELNPYPNRYYFLLGSLYFQVLDFQRGGQALEKAVEMAPSNPYAHMRFAIIYFNQALIEHPFDVENSRYFVEGLERYKEAALMAPGLSLYRYRDYLRDYRALQSAVQTALASDLNFQESRMVYLLNRSFEQSEKLGIPLREAKLFRQARDIYERILQIDPSFNLFRLKADIGDIKKVQSAFDELERKLASAGEE